MRNFPRRTWPRTSPADEDPARGTHHELGGCPPTLHPAHRSPRSPSAFSQLDAPSKDHNNSGTTQERGPPAPTAPQTPPPPPAMHLSRKRTWLQGGTKQAPPCHLASNTQVALPESYGSNIAGIVHAPPASLRACAACVSSTSLLLDSDSWHTQMSPPRVHHPRLENLDRPCPSTLETTGQRC